MIGNSTYSRSAKHESGFTIIEVVIALAILGLFLGGLLMVQGQSYENAARSRDLTIATLLMRSKLIDIEQYLFDEGFKDGEETEEGDFSEEGHATYKWSARIFPIRMDLSSLSAMAEGLGGEEGDDGGDGGFESTLGMMGGPLELFTEKISNSIRMVEIKVTWPVGRKHEETVVVRSLVTREDFQAVAPETTSSDPGGGGGDEEGQQ